MENKTYFPEPAKKPSINVPAGMNLYWNSNTGHWALRPISGYSATYLKKDSFIPKKHTEAKKNTKNGPKANSENKNLHKAKAEKNDEFYTRLEDIVEELKHYGKEFFEGKVVYCPCDKAFNLGRSNFVQFFIEHFVDWGIKKLIATQYVEGGHGIKWVIERGDVNGNGYIDESEIDTYELSGDGDFASDECRKLMQECDIVVTNPPFSLFRPFVSQIMEFNKKFLIIGNMNAITYKEIFPLIKENKMWLGFTAPKIFEVPLDKVANEKTQFEEDGKVFQKFGNILWYTNLVHSKRLEGIYCPQKYVGREDKYPVYDNYDAIEIGHYTKKGKWEGSLDELPYDYDGVMGVPVTFLDQYSPEQFEIVNLSRYITDSRGMSKEFVDEYYRQGNTGQICEGHPDLCFYGDNGSTIVPYMRVLIRRKK